MLLLVLAAVSSERGRERIAALAEGGSRPEPADRIAELSAELDQLRTELRLLTGENKALAGQLRQPADRSALAAGFTSDDDAVRIALSALPLDEEPPAPDSLSDGDVLTMLSQTAPARGSGAGANQPLTTVSAPAASGGAVASLDEGAQFALELGVGDSPAAAQSLWQQLSEQAPEVLGDLEPMVATAPGPGGATRHRLLAGPFANAATALNACVLLTLREIACQPAAYEGQAIVAR